MRRESGEREGVLGMCKSERETNEKAFKMSTRPQNIVCKMVEKGVQCVCGCLYVCVCMRVYACRQYRQTTFAVAQSRPSERVEVEVMARVEA